MSRSNRISRRFGGNAISLHFVALAANETINLEPPTCSRTPNKETVAAREARRAG